MPMPAPQDRLRLPAIVAPMSLTSPADPVAASGKGGPSGTFHGPNAGGSADLDDWPGRIADGLALLPGPAPRGASLMVRKANGCLAVALDIVVRHRVPVAITAFGIEPEVIAAKHPCGRIILHDVANRRHAPKATVSRVDRKVALTPGAVGHTGSLSLFAGTAEKGRFFGGIGMPASAISAGAAIARATGADPVITATRAAEEVMRAQKEPMPGAIALEILPIARLTDASAILVRISVIAAGPDTDNLSAHEGIAPSLKTRRASRSARYGVGSVTGICGRRTLRAAGARISRRGPHAGGGYARRAPRPRDQGRRNT